MPKDPAWKNVSLLDEGLDEDADIRSTLLRSTSSDHRTSPRTSGEHRRRSRRATSDGYDELDFA
jgi:hypothetical protein